MIQDAGKFDIRIMIQKHGEPVPIISGEPVPTWEEHYQTWAKRMPVSTKMIEEVEAMAMTSSDFSEFLIRYPKSVSLPTTKMQVVEIATNTIHDIENIIPEGRRQYLVLRCKQKQQR